MSGKVVLTYSSNWDLLSNSLLQKFTPANQIYYPWICITKSYARADHLKQKFVKLNSSNVNIIPGIYSWNQFVEELYKNFPESKQLLTLSDQLILIYQVIQNINDHLNYFSLNNKPFSPSITRSLQLIINAFLMQQSNNTNEVEESGNSFQTEIELIINEYQKIKENLFVDETDVLNLIIRELDKELLKQIFPGVNKLFWEIDTPVYPLQLKILEKLRASDWDVNIHMLYDDHPDFFKNMSNTYQQISDISDNVTKIEDPTALTKKIYRLNQKKIQFNKKLMLVKYSDRVEEAEEVAKYLKRNIIDEGIEPDKFIVTAADIFQYLPLLKNAFKKLGVPFSVFNSVQLRDLLPIQHLQLLLELLHENGELSILIKILKSPFYNYNEQIKQIPFEEILNSLRIQFDLEIILRQLEKSIEFDEGYSSEDSRADRDQDNKKVLLKVLQNIKKDIEPLTRSFTAEVFFNFFISIIEKQDVVKRVLNWKENFPLNNVADILGALRVFVNSLDNWRNLENKINEQKTYKSSQALDLFQLLISNAFYQSFEPQEYGIQILPLQLAENCDPQKLFLLGFTDNNFPRINTQTLKNLPEPIDQLLPDNQLLEDRRVFLKLLQSSAQEIRISYPEREGDSANVPSNLVLELERITSEKITTLEPEMVFSKSEIFTWLMNDTNSTDFRSAYFSADEQSHFDRQIKIVNQRNNLDKPFGIYEGDLSLDNATSKYLQHTFESKQFSVSALEIYAISPMKYFFRRILNVNEPEVFEDWMTPLEKGKMLHRVLFRFYSENEEEKRSLENLIKIAEEEIQKFPFLPSILWDLQKEAFLGGLFPAFFEYETNQLLTVPLKPEKFEVPFGQFWKRIKTEYPGGFEKPFEIRMNEDSLNMRGVVDRIEMTENGGVVVIDYKSGNLASLKDIENGKSLQLPIYLKAMIELLNQDNSNYYPLGAGYYQIKDEKEIKKEILFSEPKFRNDTLVSKIKFPTSELGNSLKEISLEDFLDRSISFAIKYANGIRRGKFIHNTNLSDCKTWSTQPCPFEPLCRVNESKLKQFKIQEKE